MLFSGQKQLVLIDVGLESVGIIKSVWSLGTNQIQSHWPFLHLKRQIIHRYETDNPSSKYLKIFQKNR